MFTADYLLHIEREEWADQELMKQVEEVAAAAIATVDQEERKKIYADLQTLLARRAAGDPDVPPGDDRGRVDDGCKGSPSTARASTTSRPRRSLSR